ncbi:DsbA family oxidoreductase [Terricaulis sp.]|uniref:DsbA family oxidoreductase n=1 Tax=Terricaulis sp. TaxID=2768686 RepID=UPI003784D702
MAAPLRIDFVSDIACPWCVIGLRGLLQALARMPEVEADIHFQPFELNPNMAPEGENTREHVMAKYGSTPERSEAARQVLRESGAKLGFTFNYSPDSRIWNTFDCHRLLHWAGLEGRQLELKEALFKANFTDQAALNDPNVLADAAVGVGLDRTRALAIVGSDEFAQEVRAEEQLWIRRGIQAVPSVVFNEKWMVRGGQPPEVFEQAIRNVLAEEAKRATA